jgi:mRNA interferase MazF
MEQQILRGDIFYADLSQGVGSEQYGLRPVLVIQNDTGNYHSPTIIIATITSKVASKAQLPTHCTIKRQRGLFKKSLVLLEQLQTIDRSRLQDYIGRLSNVDMENVDRALAVSVGLEEFLL